jgi:hypothetical protein
MLNKLVIPDIEFDFIYEDDYYKARSSGYIDDYKMARVTRKYSDGSSIDYPCHSKEEFLKDIMNHHMSEGLVSFEAYQSVHYYDINDYD